jgi:GNAT superfamily N-acetyltransferase
MIAKKTINRNCLIPNEGGFPPAGSVVFNELARDSILTTAVNVGAVRRVRIGVTSRWHSLTGSGRLSGAERWMATGPADTTSLKAEDCPSLCFRYQWNVDAQLQIRRLAPMDAALYRDIRLEGLRRNPEAFASTFEAENARPLAFFSDRIGDSTTFGVFHGSGLVGIAGLLIHEGKKEAQNGLLVGMYVRPNARKVEVGRRLGGTIVEFVRHRLELVQLSMVRDNEAARLYERPGFVEYGIERKALKARWPLLR